MCKTSILFIQYWKSFSTETEKLGRPFVISHGTRNRRQHTESSGRRFKSQVRQSTFSTLCSRGHCHRMMQAPKRMWVRKGDRQIHSVCMLGGNLQGLLNNSNKKNEDTTYLGKP